MRFVELMFIQKLRIHYSSHSFPNFELSRSHSFLSGPKAASLSMGAVSFMVIEDGGMGEMEDIFGTKHFYLED